MHVRLHNDHHPVSHKEEEAGKPGMSPRGYVKAVLKDLVERIIMIALTMIKVSKFARKCQKHVHFRG